MGAIGNFFSKFDIVVELLSFLWHNKRWWLIPVIAVLFIIGIILIFPHGSAISPFIYSLF